MAEEFLATEITIKRGKRIRHEDGSWEWVDGEPKNVKIGMVIQRDDSMTKSFLTQLHKTITDIMGKLYEDWKADNTPKQIVTDVSAGVRKAIEEGGE